MKHTCNGWKYAHSTQGNIVPSKAAPLKVRFNTLGILLRVRSEPRAPLVCTTSRFKCRFHIVPLHFLCTVIVCMSHNCRSVQHNRSKPRPEHHSPAYRFITSVKGRSAQQFSKCRTRLLYYLYPATTCTTSTRYCRLSVLRKLS